MQDVNKNMQSGFAKIFSFSMKKAKSRAEPMAQGAKK